MAFCIGAPMFGQVEHHVFEIGPINRLVVLPERYLLRLVIGPTSKPSYDSTKLVRSDAMLLQIILGCDIIPEFAIQHQVFRHLICDVLRQLVWDAVPGIEGALRWI